MQKVLNFETPWSMPELSECYWYHSMQFPDGDSVRGSWAIPDFNNYVGGYDLRGKTVLDVGTASGYLAFHAEQAGAIVTGLEAATTDEFRHVPFATAPSYIDLMASRKTWTDDNLIPVKKSFWYAWHKFNSKSKCTYMPHIDLYKETEMFDVVIAGAIIEHLSDPIFAIGAWSKVAKEAIIISFTDVLQTNDLVMAPMTPWTDARFNYAWWALSAGLYRQVLANVGFDFTVVTSHAQFNDDPSITTLSERPTIIARRIAR